MNITTMPVSELKFHETNVRKHPQKQIDEMIRSIEMFGQIRPVIIDENKVILAGNGLTEALQQMGAEEARVLEMKNLSEAEKKKLMIADNRIYSLGFDNMDNIFAVLGEIGDFDVPGYEEDLLRDLLADEDDVEDMIDDFGKLDPEEKAGFEKEAEQRERAIERAENTPEPVTPAQETPTAPTAVVTPPTVETPAPTPTVEPKESAEVEKSITCPHCGEKVWL